jgi:lipopolysaccharide/colanic/teichoic acid biosynthesis glycosyltransferase
MSRRARTKCGFDGVLEIMDRLSDLAHPGEAIRSPARLRCAAASSRGSELKAVPFKASAAEFIGLRGGPGSLPQPQSFAETPKRIFDLTVGILALIVALPILAIASLMILLEDGTPIVFIQTRVGQDGRPFEMLKLRTMVRDAQKMQHVLEIRDVADRYLYRSRNDLRITKIGRALRRFSIDELPQLFNVLGGDMSLVGPRPELPDIVRRYEPWQLERLAMPQGITGWWQVSGRSDRPMHLHTEDDLYYIRNYSFWLDLKIILRTVWVVLLGRGAY